MRSEKEIRIELAEVLMLMGHKATATALRKPYNKPNIPLEVVLAYMAILEERAKH